MTAFQVKELEAITAWLLTLEPDFLEDFKERLAVYVGDFPDSTPAEYLQACEAAKASTLALMQKVDSRGEQ